MKMQTHRMFSTRQQTVALGDEGRLTHAAAWANPEDVILGTGSRRRRLYVV